MATAVVARPACGCCCRRGRCRLAAALAALACWRSLGLGWLLSTAQVATAGRLGLGDACLLHLAGGHGRSPPSAAVTFRNPVYCAIWFALSLLGTAGLFLFQGAQFLGVATVVVYAGAILVTFLFVLMLAQPAGSAFYDRLSWDAPWPRWPACCWSAC